MSGVSIVAVLKAQEHQKAAEKLSLRSLRDASDPLSYPSSVFISYYRLNKEAFVIVLDTIQPLLQRSTIPPILQLSTTLRFLATGSQWIKLKFSTDEKRNSKAYFYQTCQIPGIIECIDGPHIIMQKPSEDESLFLNRKGTFSVNAMIICDYQMKVRAVEAGLAMIHLFGTWLVQATTFLIIITVGIKIRGCYIILAMAWNLL